MEISRAIPHATLRGVVRAFEERRASLGSAVLSWPVAARPHQILDVHLADPYRVRLDGGPAKTVSDTIVVGPQTYRRAQLYLSGEIHVFMILFQPAGLNRLVGIDMTALVNQDPSASEILGAGASVLDSAIRRAADFQSRVAAAERWIGIAMQERGPEEAIGYASRLLIATRGRVRIDDLVERSDLGARQFQRRFATQVGLTPKLYARTIRFDRALVARRKAPQRPWTDIVHEVGYFDQAHFVRECHALAGLPPSAFVGDWDNIFFPAEV
ncbi:AraC family transcriptional regulator [Afipia sp. GAS231]|uniref:helix-turn-helix domain-containing protein n=1 Tax=Afipia sp. GAS231 TaxID=1882747 RepID=UPI00087A329B|nr:helix-turn-helix domain-containing protein [Afipia sp. GAS231]SDP34664.1 Helix-turn-helix domain-containing protein [Afipia sp. GAS231]